MKTVLALLAPAAPPRHGVHRPAPARSTDEKRCHGRFAQARRIMGLSLAYLELQIEGVAGVPRRSFRWESKAFE